MLAGAPLAVFVSIIGLLLIALGTFAIGSGDLPFSVVGGKGPGASGDVGPAKTPTPSGVVVVPSDVPPGVQVPGTIVYAKDGNIWLQTDGEATQLTTAGTDSMPSFTADGKNVFFIRTRQMTGWWPVLGVLNRYVMDVPSVMEVPTSGGSPKRILDGLFRGGGSKTWMNWIREPVLAPNGRTLAIATDLPDPTKGDVVLKLYDLAKKKLTDPKVPEVPPLGQQDPSWRPDGAVLAYVYNNRNGAVGAPQIYGYTVATKQAKPISGPGYLHPSWSPDGKYLAVTKTSAYGTDIAIINASTGAEVSLLTNDGSSWGPVWSPVGDQIAYLHASGQVVDLKLVVLKGSYGAWDPGDSIDLTQSAGLDSISHPDWFVPASLMPAATPAPSTSTPSAPSGGTSAAPSPS
jgi:Tol biopolymer transport system component